MKRQIQKTGRETHPKDKRLKETDPKDWKRDKSTILKERQIQKTERVTNQQDKNPRDKSKRLKERQIQKTERDKSKRLKERQIQKTDWKKSKRLKERQIQKTEWKTNPKDWMKERVCAWYVAAYMDHGPLLLHGLLVTHRLWALLQFLRGLQDPVVVLCQSVVKHLVVGHIFLPLGDQVLHTANDKWSRGTVFYACFQPGHQRPIWSSVCNQV